MKRIAFYLFFISISYSSVNSQYKIGIQAGVALNFQTVNSIIRSGLAHQIEYRGVGDKYKMGVCFNTGLMFETKILRNIEACLTTEYMLKKNRVFDYTGQYRFDLDYHYFRLPVGVKIRKSEYFYYDFGIVNNFLLKYEKDKLFRTLVSQNIRDIRNYNVGITAGFGFVLFKKYELFIKAETDITPFLTTSDYGGERYYPFKFHDITIGLRYWLYQKVKQ